MKIHTHIPTYIHINISDWKHYCNKKYPKALQPPAPQEPGEQHCLTKLRPWHSECWSRDNAACAANYPSGHRHSEGRGGVKVGAGMRVGLRTRFSLHWWSNVSLFSFPTGHAQQSGPATCNWGVGYAPRFWSGRWDHRVVVPQRYQIPHLPDDITIHTCHDLEQKWPGLHAHTATPWGRRELRFEAVRPQQQPCCLLTGELNTQPHSTPRAPDFLFVKRRKWKYASHVVTLKIKWRMTFNEPVTATFGMKCSRKYWKVCLEILFTVVTNRKGEIICQWFK